MDLSNDLISKFVKITNDGNKKETKEGTVYGTAVKYDGSIYVKIDGSDLLTPIDTTADIKEGERVTIMIKDHNATVTGNITSPSASSADVKKVTRNVEEIEGEITEFEAIIADVVHVGELDAEVARIDELIAGKATIEDLTATNAEITNLKAKDAEIENLVADKATIEDLTATNAEITNLKANKADITYLDANFATIDELEATHADIDVLDAEVANINTLVNGNLTSDNILSFNITSKNTTMEDAFIKDAMIDRITANKIMSGTIDTNNVVIQSTDGSMLLQGNILQMKDESGKVRIQIGKDNGGNFTFVLYDETGKGVLIDEEGIKSSDAIADGLIVDAKVADNANISGSKLDIASVITEVNNDNSTTIKSSKIYLNEQNQSLEVAFNSLKTQVETIQDVTIDGDLSNIVEQVQSNTTKIEANKEGINTLVAENVIRTEEISDLEGELQQVNTTLSNKYASLEQNLDGFKTTVSDTYTTKTEFDNLELGGRNLIIRSTEAKDYCVGKDGAPMQYAGNAISDYISVLPDTIYTFTKTNTAITDGYFRISWHDENKTFISRESFIYNKARRKSPTNAYFIRVSYPIDSLPKLEKGNKATDWTPAPEDVQANIDAVDGKFTNYSTTTQMNSAIQQKANEITSSVSQTYTTKTEFDNLKIGARNYVLNSGLTKDSSSFVLGAGWVSRDTSKKTPNGNNSIYFDVSGLTTNRWISGYQQIGNRLEVGKTYTIGANAFVPSNHGLDRGASLEIICWNSSDARTGTFYVEINTSIVDKWQSVSQTFTVPANTIRYSLQVYVVRNGKLYAGDYSLVEGDKSIWTPAPEDVQGQIDAVDGKFANYSTTTQMNSAIQQKANEITSSVSSTYTTKTEFQNLAIGGTNLLVGGKFETYTDYQTISSQIGSKEVTFKWISSYSSNLFTLANNVFQPKGEYTVSGYIKVNNAIPSSKYFTGYASTYGSNLKENYYDSSTGYFRITQTYPGNSRWILHGYTTRTAGSTDTVTLSKLKFEKGSKATDWTPAPEDVQANIDAVDGKFANYSTTTQMNSAINQKANEITSSVSSTYTTKTEFNNLKVGGRNLIKQSNVVNRNATSASYDKNTATWTLTANAGTGGNWGVGLAIVGDNVRIPYGKTYVLSFEIKVPRACSWNIDVNNYAVTGSSWGDNDNDSASARATSSKSLVANQWIKCWSRISNASSGNTNKVDIYDNSNFGVVMLNETSSMTYQIRNIQGEIGNIPSEYSPAPEDVQAQIDTATNTANTANSIANSNKSNISSLTTRVSNAESKLTKDSLTTTIGSYYTTSSDVNNAITSKGYATTSQVQQTVDSLSAKFSSSGGYNKLYNTSFLNGTTSWGNNGGTLSIVNDTNSPTGKVIKVVASGSAKGIYQHYTPNKTGYYTVSFYGRADASMKINFGQEGSATKTVTLTTSWQKFSHTFNRTSTSTNAYVFYPLSAGTFYMHSILVEEGELCGVWSPHPDEVYSGITKIDKDGVKVSQSNYNGYTQMKADGFYVNNGSENVISITKDGSYFKGKVVITSGSTVPTSVLSGTISSSQLNSSITSDISTAKSNASTAVSTANTASTNASNAVKTANTASTNASNAVKTANTANTNASNAVKTANTASTNASTAVSTANTAKSTAETANSTANSVKSTVDSGKTNWNNAYNRVNEWAYGAVTGSTTIDGGYIQADTITAKHMAIGDFNNYSQLVKGKSLVNRYGTATWTEGTSNHSYWVTTNRYFPFTVNETLNPFKASDRVQIKFDAYTPSTRNVKVGIWFYSGTAADTNNIGANTADVSCSATWGTKTVNLTLPNGNTYVQSAKSIAILIDNGTSGERIEVRNVTIRRLVAGDLIVDGAITAAKIASRTITADRIVSGAITANEIAAGAITAAKISSGAITADKLAANAITSKTITGSTITGGTISGATITSETLMKTYGGMYVGSEIWGGFKKDSNGNYSSAQTFTIRGSTALQIDGNPTRISSVTGEVKIGDASSYDNLRARCLYAQEIVYTDDIRARTTGAALLMENISMRTANAYVQFTSGLGVVRVKERNHLYLQTGGNTGGDTSAEIRCTRCGDPSNYVNIRAYNVCAQNAVYANGVNVSSDINRKRDIELYSTDALHEVCTTPVYTYHLDTDKDEELKRIGIIMQEAPLDAIDLTGKGVDLYQMVTMLWRAVQQQQEIINELKGE